MKIVIAGGSGFLGGELANFFKEQGYDVVIFTRGESRNKDGFQFVHWDATTLGDWTSELIGCDTLINLTGKSVDCRYTEENKKEIIRSRVDSTSILGEAIESMEYPPKTWINSSTATIYRHSEDKAMTEENCEYGDDFSMNVAKSWEQAFNASNTPQTRKLALRISLVLGKSGGVYPVMRRLAKFFVGGKMGSGRQVFAWIHIDDVKNLVKFCIENEGISGPVNCTAPNPPTNKGFLKMLRKSLKVPFGLPTPKFLLKLGGAIIGTESELVLKSRWVLPEKLIQAGYKFQYENPEDALENLAKK